MKLKVLTVIIAEKNYKLSYANYPSRTYTIHEYEKKHGYNSIAYKDVEIKGYHIVPKANIFYMYTQAFQLQQYLKSNKYDAVHFYFESSEITTNNMPYWHRFFSFGFTAEKKSGLPPYFFTDSNYNIPLRQVTNGLYYSIPSDGYSDFIESLQY